jgi:uncharacterized protein
MLNPPLPSHLDVRKLTVKGAEICADALLSSMPRVVDLLAEKEGVITVNLSFYRDEQRFRRIDGQLTGSVTVFCQRCLEPMPVAVDTQFKLAIVWSEDDAERLPKSLEPIIVGEELVNIADLISEELLLSLPYVNYHKAADCKQEIGYSSTDPEVKKRLSEAEAKGELKQNPFKVLAKLKGDKQDT